MFITIFGRFPPPPLNLAFGSPKSSFFIPFSKTYGRSSLKKYNFYLGKQSYSSSYGRAILTETVSTLVIFQLILVYVYKGNYSVSAGSGKLAYVHLKSFC